jgi:hypothetical protein
MLIYNLSSSRLPFILVCVSDQSVSVFLFTAGIKYLKNIFPLPPNNNKIWFEWGNNRKGMLRSCELFIIAIWKNFLPLFAGLCL